LLTSVGGKGHDMNAGNVFAVIMSAPFASLHVTLHRYTQQAQDFPQTYW
jgi:hypothetical protein